MLNNNKKKNLNNLLEILEKLQIKMYVLQTSRNFTKFNEDDVTVKTILGMYVDNVGTLTCSGYNKIGSAVNASSVVYAAEIENGFGISISHKNLIADGDNVSLICIASIFTYPNKTLKWYRMPGDRQIDPDISNGNRN